MRWAVIEYLERKQLVAMGFRFDVNSIPAHRIDALLAVDSKWNELVARKREANKPKYRKR
jgi:hypothetical protein